MGNDEARECAREGCDNTLSPTANSRQKFCGASDCNEMRARERKRDQRHRQRPRSHDAEQRRINVAAANDDHQQRHDPFEAWYFEGTLKVQHGLDDRNQLLRDKMLSSGEHAEECSCGHIISAESAPKLAAARRAHQKRCITITQGDHWSVRAMQRQRERWVRRRGATADDLAERQDQRREAFYERERRRRLELVDPIGSMPDKVEAEAA